MNKVTPTISVCATGLLFLLLISSGTVFGQQKVMRMPISKGKELLVRITEPEGFSKDRAYPVLLGPGLDGGDLKAGCRYFGANADRHGWILVESLVHMEKRSAVKVLLDYLEANYTIRELYILGFSANSVDAFQIAEMYPDKFTGVIGMPGNPGFNDRDRLKSLSKTKILMIVGERDTYWKNRAVKAKEKLDQLGICNKLVIVPNGGHILDEFAGSPLFKELNGLIAH
jgi:pimeloyl-ACP methyl ester carboxylesterase